MAGSVAKWDIPPEEDWRPVTCLWRTFQRVPWYAYPVLLGLVGVSIYFSIGGFFGATWGVLGWLLMRRKPEPKVLRMAQFPPPGDQFPVDLVFYRDGIPYGEDTGIVTFLEGWLLFEGLHTSFSIRRRDVDAWDKTERRMYATDQRIPHWLAWYRQGGWHSVGIRPLPVFLDDEGNRVPSPQLEFDRVMHAWTLEPRNLKGRSILPPDHPHPLGFYKARIFLWWSRVFALATLASLVAIPFQSPMGMLYFTIVMSIVGTVTSIWLYRTFVARQRVLEWMASDYAPRLSPRPIGRLPMSRKKQ